MPPRRGMSTTRVRPINRSSDRSSAAGLPSKKCSGASTCVAVCVPITTRETLELPPSAIRLIGCSSNVWIARVRRDAGSERHADVQEASHGHISSRSTPAPAQLVRRFLTADRPSPIVARRREPSRLGRHDRRASTDARPSTLPLVRHRDARRCRARPRKNPTRSGPIAPKSCSVVKARPSSRLADAEMAGKRVPSDLGHPVAERLPQGAARNVRSLHRHDRRRRR